MKVISEKRTFTDGRRTTKFEMRTDVPPSTAQVTESQLRCGYHPCGYGGPYHIDTNKVDGVYVTVWECAGSCD
jgi:hypothetical protein